MNKFNFVFRSLHVIWAIIGTSVTLVLTLSKGHPPGIIFVPVALVFWGIGHGFLWASCKLVIKGKNSPENYGSERKIPSTLVILSLLFGAIFFVGFVQLIFTMMDKYNRQSELLTILVVWLPSSICFIGILLRQAWSRILASGIFVTTALFLLYQMIESIVVGNQHSFFDWITAAIITVSFLFLGRHILRSSRIKEFCVR